MIAVTTPTGHVGSRVVRLLLQAPTTLAAWAYAHRGLLRGGAIGWRHRILHDAHFEFRGGEPEPRERPMREDR